MILALVGIATLHGQIRWSGDIAITLKGLDRHLTENTNFRGDDPFNELRFRLFPRYWINDRMGIFGELLYDNGVKGGTIRVNGAYAVINRVLGQHWLNLKAGMIPSPFGNYGLRSSYFNLNPLIGVPLMWHHRTHLEGDSYATRDALLVNRAKDHGYLPIGYDACWEIGWELFGELGMLEYSLALTEGTMSNPTERDNDGRQVIVKMGLNPLIGIRFGASIASGPYLSPTAADTLYVKVEDYAATAAGLYFELKTGFIQLYSEFITSTWESPYIDSDELLTLYSGYLEGRYDILPNLYVAARADIVEYSKLLNADQTGEETWGDPLRRVELGLGYRLTREVLIKSVYQQNDYSSKYAPDRTDKKVIALQLHMVF